MLVRSAFWEHHALNRILQLLRFFSVLLSKQEVNFLHVEIRLVFHIVSSVAIIIATSNTLR